MVRVVPTERFAEIMRAEEQAVPLDEAALLIAAHAHPTLDIAHQLARMDELAAKVADPDVASVCELLFGAEGFAGNRDDYYDVENSYLDTVLDRRRGIPISLSVLLIEIARRAGVVMVGVGMPGHFLTATAGEPRVYVDAFDGGRQLSVDDCAALFVTQSGGQPFDPALLAPVGPFAIIARMLANLKGIAAQAQDRAMLTWVLRLRCAVPGVPLAERRELAGVLVANGQVVDAAHELEALADLTADPAASDAFRRRAVSLRAQLN